jgi:cell wall-associated NlpC family hydrolase
LASLVVSNARKYLDVKFYHAGRNHLGMDCAGLVVLAYRDSGIELQDFKGDYGREYDRARIKRALEKDFYRVTDMQAGDVLLIRFDNPQHFAICSGEGTMIHSYEKAGKVVEVRLADVWLARIKGVYRCHRLSK